MQKTWHYVEHEKNTYILRGKTTPAETEVSDDSNFFATSHVSLNDHKNCTSIGFTDICLGLQIDICK